MQRYGCELRRLYSGFAGSWPGAALLLMRLVVGSVLLVRAGPKLWMTDAPLHAMVTSASLAASGLLLIAGLWTPLAGAVVGVLELSSLLTTGPDRLVCLLAGTVGGALAMLGPGRWSVDARLFGWKRIEAPPRKSSFERALNSEASGRPDFRPGAGPSGPSSTRAA